MLIKINWQSDFFPFDQWMKIIYLITLIKWMSNYLLSD